MVSDTGTWPRRLAAVATLAGGVAWLRRHPSACPYALRLSIQVPHPFVTRRRLLEVLAPAPGERVLEVGPGTGYYSLDVAQRCGTLALVDVQRRMLDHTLRRARERGLANVEAEQADARELPYEDASFDAAFLVTVLGEVPDQRQALRELHRVLRPGGRLVVGELLLDPHWVSPRALDRMAAAAGFEPDGRVGSVGYFARYRRPS